MKRHSVREKESRTELRSESGSQAKINEEMLESSKQSRARESKAACKLTGFLASDDCSEGERESDEYKMLTESGMS